MIILTTVTAVSLAAIALIRRLFSPKSWLDLKPLAHADLKRIPYFHGLSALQLEQVTKLIREVRIPTGNFVMREHHVGDALYLVVSGRVNILKRGAHEQTLVQSVGPGEFIGEMALLCNVKRIASAQTEAASVLIHIDREDFQAFLAVSEDIRAAVWAACDRHAIDYLLRDHEKLRSLSLTERAAWIERRESDFHGKGDMVKVARDGFVGLISGSAVVGGRHVEAPALVPCAAGQDIEVTSEGRVTFLGAPQAKRAA